MCQLVIAAQQSTSKVSGLKAMTYFFHVSKGGYDRPSAGLFGDIHAVALGDPLGSLFAKLVVVQTT